MRAINNEPTTLLNQYDVARLTGNVRRVHQEIPASSSGTKVLETKLRSEVPSGRLEVLLARIASVRRATGGQIVMPKKAKSAAVGSGHQGITVSNWTPIEHGDLRGFLTLTLPSGLAIHNCQLIETGGRRWVGLPSRRFQTADGDIHYKPMIEFTTPRAHRTFGQTALAAVEHFLKARGERQSP